MNPIQFSNEVVDVARVYFPFVTEENFSDLFRLSVVTFCLVCNSDRKMIRNLLILLFQLKHYLPIRATCILFNMSKSRLDQIFKSTLRWIVDNYGNRLMDPVLVIISKSDEIVWC